MSARNIPGLLRRNPNLKFLWWGQIVSQLGDWFNSIALYALVFELTGSATSVALVMVLQFLPTTIVTPFAGVFVDRFDRRKIMIAADIVRGIVILGLLFVKTPGTVWIAYVVVAVAVSAAAFFEPAKSSTLPSIVAREDLVTANALSTGTWSVMLATGAALGGFFAAKFGRDTTFVLNAVSFFVSAILVAKIRVPPRSQVTALVGFAPLFEGFRYLRDHREIASFAVIKAGWALVGGALLILTVIGQRVFPINGSADAGMGVLYGARGLGALAGSWIVTHVAAQPGGRLTRMIAPAFLLAGGFYALVGVAPSIWIAAAFVIGAHACGSILWVASNVLLQMNVREQFRGRVFSVELAALTLIQSVASYITARLLDGYGLDPRRLAVGCGLALWIPGLAWAIRSARSARA